MKKLLILLPLLFVLACVDSEQVQGAASLGNPDPMSVSCATGYTRLFPHYCQRTGQGGTTLTADGACHSLDLTAGPFNMPVSVSVARGHYGALMVSQNVTGTRQIQVNFFTASGCTTQTTPTFNFQAREEVAVVAGTVLSQQANYASDFVTNAGQLWYIVSFTTCTNCQFSFYPSGYYD